MSGSVETERERSGETRGLLSTRSSVAVERRVRSSVGERGGKGATGLVGNIRSYWHWNLGQVSFTELRRGVVGWIVV